MEDQKTEGQSAKNQKGELRDLKERTRDFALRVIKLYGALPRKTECVIIGKQMLRSGTSVGAHYREGLRARSPSEYAAKLNAGLIELEETLYWLELLEGASFIPAPRLSRLESEISELSAIFVSLIKRARAQAQEGSRNVPAGAPTSAV